MFQNLWGSCNLMFRKMTIIQHYRLYTHKNGPDRWQRPPHLRYTSRTRRPLKRIHGISSAFPRTHHQQNIFISCNHRFFYSIAGLGFIYCVQYRLTQSWRVNGQCPRYTTQTLGDTWAVMNTESLGRKVMHGEVLWEFFLVHLHFLGWCNWDHTSVEVPA